MDRYAYVGNSPIRYIDPSGHFTEAAIKKYLKEYCNGHSDCVDDMLADWKADEEWWDMLNEAQAGDVLFGLWQHEGEGVSHSFYYVFDGIGKTDLYGISVSGTATDTQVIPTNQSLDDIQRGIGTASTVISASGYYGTTISFKWIGIARPGQRPNDFPYLRPGSEIIEYGGPSSATTFLGKWVIGFIPGFVLCGGSGIGAAECGVGTTIFGDSVNDAFDIEQQDYALSVDGVYFNFQVSNNPNHEWSIEAPISR